MAKHPRKEKPANCVKPYEPELQERAAVKAYFARCNEKPPGPRMSEKGGVIQIAPDHPDLATGQVLLMGALGTTDPDFAEGLLAQLASAGTRGRTVDRRGLNFM